MKKITLQFIAAAFLFLISNINLFSQINFTTSPNNQCGPMVVTFTNTTTIAGAYKYEWNFGDGSPMLINYTPTTFTHTYNASGSYSPNVNVYNNTNGYLGNSYGSSGNIQVNGAGISSPDSACATDQINFCMSNGQANSYAWNFGDGATSTNGGCVSHAYSTVGTYTVTLVANTQSCGNQTSTRKVVVANNVKPQANAWTNTNSTCPAKPMSFNTGTYSSYSWNFGDASSGANNTSTLQYPSHLYGTVGTYTVTLTVSNACGKTASTAITASIVNKPSWPNQSWFSMSVNGSPACPNSSIGLNAPSGYSSYEWNFGDGSPLASSTNNYNNHTYGSSVGKYTVSVKIPSGCGNDTTLYDTVKITNTAHFPNQSWFALKGNPVACPGSNAGFQAPNGYSTYVWNYGDGSPLYTTSNTNTNHQYSNTITTYTVSVKITNGCGNDSTLYTTLQIKNNVGFPTQDFQIYGGPNPACPGDEVNWDAPNGYANYRWTFGDGDTVNSGKNNINHKYVSAGTYTVRVKITNNCGKDTTISSLITINNSGTFPSWLSIESTPSACPDDLLEFRFNQNGYSAYHWNFGDGNLVTSNGERIQHAYTSTGTYTVTCRVANGCGNSKTVSTTVLINNTSPVSSNLSIGSTQNPSCPNDEIFLIINEGAQPNYKYYWNFGDGTAKDTTVGSGSSHVFTSVGTYTVTATVTNGCGMTKVVTMTQVVNNTSVPTLTNNEGKRNWGFPGSNENVGSGNQNAGCKGDAIIFYFMGSSPNNLWDFGDGNKETATESMLVYGGDGSFPVTIIKHAYAANGTYKIKLTITNNCGKSVTDSMNIVVGGGMVVNGDMTTSPPPFSTCAPIDFLAFGGSDYEYNFGDGSTLNTVSPTVTHTFATKGVYVISVLVTNGCGNTATYSRSINVNGVGGPAVTLTSSTNPTCLNYNNGNASVSVTNGQPPYKYLWNDVNGQTTLTATGLSARLYDVVVTDAIGCASTLAISITNPAPIVLQVSTTTTSCGGTTGTASVSASSGGISPFTYSWSTGGTGASVGGLSTGVYSVTVNDVNGCSSLANASISESGGATLAVASSTNVSCNGSSNGAIDINVTGGTPPYTYLWSNGSTTQDIMGLSAGNYSVLVSDAGACKATINKTITEPSVLATTTAVISPTCGNFDGTASASGGGGTGPYTYLWDPGAGSNKTTQSVSG
nr:PKD domain-containing protein [Bacteroidota bacterium]